MGKKTYIGIGIVVVVALLLLVRPGMNGYVALDNFDGDVDFYKSASCGCCGIHADYLSGSGGLDVEMNVLESVEGIKDEYGVPNNLRTCHTAVIDGYFVEGHVPLEAINKLIKERPDIAGIALPGMPAGSPGMPGSKNSDWIIYSVNHDGSYEEWMVI